MNVFRLCKFFSTRSNIPYITLSADDLSQKISSRVSSEHLLPPFEDMKKIRKFKKGMMTSLGIISIGMSLAGLAILVDAEMTANQRNIEIEIRVPPRPKSV
uniref:Uncharacterized protein n=1 Tax=Caenorhabditis japonica TaxID=281687 RepID=A0A8R1DPJ0_CAEJA